MNFDAFSFSFSVVAVILSSIACGFGFYLIKFPEEAIRFQIRFYEKINWKMEPVSMGLEIRNTRWMGMASVVCAVMAVFYVLIFMT